MLASLLLITGGCQSKPAVEAGLHEPPPDTLRPAFYAAAADRGEAVYEVDTAGSSVVALVRRDGPLARFGHDHAIAVPDIRGYVLWSPSVAADSCADLAVDVSRLDVDPPEARQAFELDTTPDQRAVDGTRHNLLEHILVASRWPTIGLRIGHAGGAPPEVRLAVELELNGVSRRISVPAQVDVTPERLSAEGRFELRPSEWGIPPFSVLGGGLRVADRVEVHFRLEASRL
jgi:polyisoprenoid-binding protein YceI